MILQSALIDYRPSIKIDCKIIEVKIRLLKVGKSVYNSVIINEY